MRHRHQMRLIAALKAPVVVALLATSSVAIARTERGERFRAARVVGSVLAWMPWRGAWQKIEAGDVVHEGALVQTLSAADILLVPIGRPATAENKLRFSMKEPTMFRLHHELARTVILSAYTMDARRTGLPNGKPSGKGKPSDKPIWMAWQRVKGMSALMREMYASTSDMLFAKAPERPMSVTSELREIVVTYPKDGAVLIVGSFPEEIAVRWEDKGVSPGESYDVYFWSTKKSRPEPLLRTSKPGAAIKIPAAGAYFMQITSVDQRAQSPSVIVNVEGP